jgi:outer membrane protein assembly factor BamD
MIRPISRAALVLTLALGISACGGRDNELEYVETPVEDLYNSAVDMIEQGRWAEATVRFDEVERQHPYSVWARRAMLMAAFTHYQNNEYEESILAARRFISLHPGHRDVAYAYYLVGICYYEQIRDVGRDQQITQQAMSSLNEVVRRFPNSEYARDARLKIDLTRDHLAGKEMDVGRWYQRREELNAAINRFRFVVSDYQTTSHVPEALHRLVECYLALGLYNEATATAAVLGYNYPGDRWYADSYNLLQVRDLVPEEQPDSWISRIWNPVERIF